MTADIGLTSAFAHSEALFRTLFLSFPDAILIMAADGHISAVSPVAEQMFGYSEPELLGKNIEALIPARFRDRHVQHREAYLAIPGPADA